MCYGVRRSILTSSRGVADDSRDFESGIWAGRIIPPRKGGINTFSNRSLQMLKPRIRVHLPQKAMKDRIHGTWAYARSQVYVHAMCSQERFLTGGSTRNFSVYSGDEGIEASTACYEGFDNLLTPATLAFPSNN